MSERPNILLIHTEHHRGDCLSVEGHPVLLTPNLDNIAYRGARCTRFYSACPTCIPTRRSMLTGQLPQTHGMVGYVEGVEWTGVPTLPGVLREHGYETVHIGRSMHQHPPRGRHGFDWMELHLDYWDWLKNQSPRHGIDDWHGGGVMHNDWTARCWHMAEDLHATNWTVERALRFMKRRDPSCPFFLSLGFVAAHPPLQPPAFYFERYLRTGAPAPYIGDWVRQPTVSTQGGGDRVSAERIELTGEALRSMRAAYYGLLNHVDDQIRRLINPVIGLAHRRDTIIMFTSDHGEMLGDHHMFRKSVAYEGSARVPLLVSAPLAMGIEPQTVVDAVATHADLVPTLLDMLAIPIPDTVDGRSLYPLLRGERCSQWRRHLHIEDARQHHALTDGREKYIWWPADGREQLFDLDADPNELHDLAREPSAAQRLRRWRERLIEELSRRPEGFVRDGQLVAGRECECLIPGSRERYAPPARP